MLSKITNAWDGIIHEEHQALDCNNSDCIGAFIMTTTTNVSVAQAKRTATIGIRGHNISHKDPLVKFQYSQKKSKK